MFKTSVIILTSAILAFCESAAIVDKVNQKCGINDSECQKTLYRSIFLEVVDNGIPDMDIPIIDPYVVKDTDVVVLGMVKLTMKDGTVKGFKTCSSNSFKIDFENQRTKIELVCEIFAIEGQYKIESTPTLLALSGGIKIHGEGTGGVVIEKLKLDLDFASEIKKLDDGELHFELIPEEANYSFEILGQVTFSADNIFVGKQDISTVAVNIFNENWEFISKSFGKTIFDKGIEVFYDCVGKFFKNVPAKDLITDDLSAYVKS